MFGNNTFSAAPFSDIGGVSDSVVVTLASTQAVSFVGSVVIKGNATASIAGVEAATAITAATTKANALVAVSGVAAVSSTLDAVTVTGKAVFSINGASASALTVGVVISGDALSFTATPAGLNTAIGTVNVTAESVTGVTGVAATGAANTITVQGMANFAVDGIEANMYAGAVNAKAAATIEVTGVGATIITDDILLVGDEVTVDAEAVVVLPSISATSAVNTVVISAVANVSVGPVFATTSIGVVNAVAEAVLTLSGVQAVAITDDILYVGDEIIVDAEAVVELVGLLLSASAGDTTVDAVKFDYSVYTEEYGRERTIYLNGNEGSNTVVIKPKDPGMTLVLTEHDKNTIARIAA